MDPSAQKEKLTFNYCATSNMVTFVIENEDHTLGNVLRHQLVNHTDGVSFAAYRMPHPLIHQIELKVQTTTKEFTPCDAVTKSVDELIHKLTIMEFQFKNEISKCVK